MRIANRDEVSRIMRPLANVGSRPRKGASSGAVTPYMNCVNATAVLAPSTLSRTRMKIAPTMIAKMTYIVSYALRAGEKRLTTSVSSGPAAASSSRTILRSSGSIPPSLWQGTLDVSAWPLLRGNAPPERATGPFSGPPEWKVGGGLIHVNVGRGAGAQRVLPNDVVAGASRVVRPPHGRVLRSVADDERRLEGPQVRAIRDVQPFRHRSTPRSGELAAPCRVAVERRHVAGVAQLVVPAFNEGLVDVGRSGTSVARRLDVDRDANALGNDVVPRQLNRRLSISGH